MIIKGASLLNKAVQMADASYEKKNQAFAIFEQIFELACHWDQVGCSKNKNTTELSAENLF